MTIDPPVHSLTLCVYTRTYVRTKGRVMGAAALGVRVVYIVQMRYA